MRKILLIEPNYTNKYPPIGLMKIATYHRLLGDDVRYFKGDLQNLVVDMLFDTCIERLQFIDHSINWRKHSRKLKLFIKTKNSSIVADEEFQNVIFAPLIMNVISEAADAYRKKLYKQDLLFDRIYITTLFTFYWKITVQTIEFCKALVKDPSQLLIGGILASLLSKELENEVGIKPMSGLLDQPGILDPTHPVGSQLIIDNLPLDYSILEEIEYEYPTKSAYFTFMTKGCTRKCAFCSVPILEPTYKPKIDTLDKFSDIKDRFGEQRNLLLMDNNVLASPKFPEIIDEIKQMGFYKGATYVEPNQLEIAIENLHRSFNDRGFIKRAFKLMHELLPRLKGEVAQRYYNHLGACRTYLFSKNLFRETPVIDCF